MSAREPKVSPLRAKVHEVGKRLLAQAKTFATCDQIAADLVELHGLIELLLEQLEDVDAEIEARVVVVLARLRSEGKL